MAQNKMFRAILWPTLWRDEWPTRTAPCRLRTVWRPGRVLRGCGQPSNSGTLHFGRQRKEAPSSGRGEVRLGLSIGALHVRSVGGAHSCLPYRGADAA